MTISKTKSRRRFIVGMAGYVATIFLAAFLIGGGQVTGLLAIVVALLPVVPFLYAMTGVFDTARAGDEFQKKLSLESVLITALVTVAVTFSYGLLELFDLAPHIPVFYVAPFMIIVWGIAQHVVARRYG